MSLTNEEILHIAKLARLKVDEKEIETMRSQIESILGYVAKLQELDTTNVEEATRGVAGSNVFREDVVNGCDADVRKRIIEAFPVRQGDLLEVQAVFEERTE